MTRFPLYIILSWALYSALILTSLSVESQIIFQETFNEPTGSIAGSANGVNWTSDCPTCLPPGDWWEIRNGAFEGTDTNGPATLTTNNIDISNCTQIEINFDVESIGSMEPCGSGCNSVDFIAFEYNIDNTGWTSPVNAYFCSGGCAAINVILDDDVGQTNYSTGCISVMGNNIQLRISVQTWAASETWRIDNIVVNCSNSNAGANSVLTLCENATHTDLFNELNGTPDIGGVWTGPTLLGNGSLGTLDPSIALSGTYTYTVGPSSCLASADVDVTLVTPPNAGLNGTTSLCSSSNTIDLFTFLNGTPDIGGTWLGPSSLNNGYLGTFDPSNMIAGVYTYSVSGVSSLCADSSATVTVVVNTQSDATITPISPLCIGAPPVTLTAVDPGGIWSGTGITDPVNGVFDPSIAGSGIHTIQYAISGPCGDTKSITLTVHSPLSAVITSNTSICEGENILLLVTPSGGDGNYTVSWLDNFSNNLGNTNSISVTPNVTTTYTSSIIDGCGNSVSLSTIITVDVMPIVEFNVDDDTGCVSHTTSFISTTTNASTYFWDFGDGKSSTIGPTVNHTFNTPGCYTVSLMIASGACTANINKPNAVCAIETAQAFFIPSAKIVEAELPKFDFTNLSSNADSFIWTFDDGNTSFDINPTHAYLSDVTAGYNVCLTALNIEGCNTTYCDSVHVRDNFTLYVPNAFTPNGNGINDLFKPVITDHSISGYELLIFDRWGKLIFQSKTPFEGWDGTYRGNGVKQDIYVWKLKVKNDLTGKWVLKQGHVTLLH